MAVIAEAPIPAAVAVVVIAEAVIVAAVIVAVAVVDTVVEVTPVEAAVAEPVTPVAVPAVAVDANTMKVADFQRLFLLYLPQISQTYADFLLTVASRHKFDTNG